MTPSPQLLAGTARRCSNPPPNIAQGSWGAQKHEQAEGIDMDLWVSVLALSDGKTIAIFVDVDIQILTNDRADGIRAAVSQATGVPIENIRASATHTHSGPVPFKSWIEKGFEMVGPWFQNVYQWAAESAQEALSNLQPVQMRAGRGECFINANRRSITPTGERFLGVNLDGPCDHEVIVIRLDTLDGNILATLVNFACHATIMGPLNRLVTPDYPGAMKRVVEQSLGGKCFFLQGAAGDQGPVQGFLKDTAVYKSMGAVLGHEVAKVATALTALPSKNNFRDITPSGAPLGNYTPEFATTPGVPLRILSKEIFVPLREALPEKGPALEKFNFWKEKLQTAKANSDAAGATEATYMARRADLQLRMADDFGGKTQTGVRAHFICFGDVALVGTNIEPFCEIGMNVKKHSPFPVTCVSGYSNGRLAYMPTAVEWPKGGYEVDNSPFGIDAAATLEKEILETLRTLRNQK